MEFYIEKVLERDIDLYIINKFINDANFKNLFLNKSGLKNYKINKCIHSLLDSDGESDITIIMENDEERVGLLIEDKIDAIAMPNQYKRYKIRGNKLIENGEINKCYLFIIAPNDYLQTNAEAKKYDYKLSYEDILKAITGDVYGEALIKKAIDEKKYGYSVIEDKAVTEFWKKYYELVELKYPMLNIKKHDSARGSRACWPIFQTGIKNVQIFHKSDKGFVDLTLKGMAKNYYEINKMLEQILKNNMHIQVTGASIAIRIKVPVIDFKKDFNEQLEKLTECLDAVLELQNLTKIIDFNEIMNIKE